MPVDASELVVDPRVSRTKFDRQLAEYRRLQDHYLRRGWWMAKAEFPEVFVVFGTPNLKPPSAIFGAILDFTNYDLRPPSVQLVEPFTRKPFLTKELPTNLMRQVPVAAPPDLVARGVATVPALQPMAMGHEADAPHFICLPGIREYHDHPAHTGDSWLLHRRTGEGTLYFILDQLSRYGSEPVKGYGLNIKVTIAGYQAEAPQ